MNLSAVNVRNFLVFCILYHFRVCESLKNLTKPCLILGDFKLKKVCTADYPEEAKRKYFDEYVEIGSSYTVFSMDGREGYYMISHGYSDLTKCGEVMVTSPNDFECGSNHIYLESATMHCLPYHTQIADHLISHCSSDAKQPKAAFTAMLYVDGGNFYGDRQLTAGAPINSIIFVSFIVMQLM